MQFRPRLYESILKTHLTENRQMAFLTGPRQVGKTTLSRSLAAVYLNWDTPDDRKTILTSMKTTMADVLAKPRVQKPIIVFDELHKNQRWKRFLKGFFDSYGDKCGVIVTGSSRMDVYQRGGDSLMGRYFLFHMHPLSVAELIRQASPLKPIQTPAKIMESEFKALLEHGGFPEPFLKRSPTFDRQWRNLRRKQLLREEVRDTTRIHELAQLEHLELLLAERSGQQLIYGNLSAEIGVTVVTIRRWIETLIALHQGFLIRPWHQNVSRSLRKEPKWYLRDWSGVADPGSKAETMVACHLLKATEGWTDLGLGDFELRYLRNKEKQEIDFIIIRDRKPWFLVEVKKSDETISPNLAYFQKQTKAEFAFQVVLDMPYIEFDCFKHHDPLVVPARTFLSQLI